MVQTRSSSEASNKNTTIKKKKRNTTRTAEDRSEYKEKNGIRRLSTEQEDEAYEEFYKVVEKKGDKFIKEYAKKYHDDKAEKSRREMKRVLMSVVYEDYSD